MSKGKLSVFRATVSVKAVDKWSNRAVIAEVTHTATVATISAEGAIAFAKREAKTTLLNMPNYPKKISTEITEEIIEVVPVLSDIKVDPAALNAEVTVG